MKATFLHLGDVHLGNEQYGRKERAGDFADAFHYAVQYAIQHGVDFVIIAGDLFERSNLDPVTFDQSVSGLAQLAAAGVPVVAIAGNHDRARYGQEQPWLQAMSRQGYLAYLDAVGPEGIRLTPWSQEEGVGGYVEVRGVRVVGFRYLGAATARVVGELAEAMRLQWDGDRPYTVAMIHGGMDGVVPNYRAEITLPPTGPTAGTGRLRGPGAHPRALRPGGVGVQPGFPGDLERHGGGPQAGIPAGGSRHHVRSLPTG